MRIFCLSWASVVPLSSHCHYHHHRWGWDNKHYRLPLNHKLHNMPIASYVQEFLLPPSAPSAPALFSHSVVSKSLWPHGLQHTRPPCPSPSPRACSNSCPVSRWCHPTISSSVIPFSCRQSFPTSGSFPMSQLFTSGGQSIGASASASVLPMNIQGWSPLGLTGPCCPRHITFKYLIWEFFFLFLFSSLPPPSATPLSWQDLSSPIRHQTQTQQWQHQVLTSGSPGNSQYLLIFI